MMLSRYIRTRYDANVPAPPCNQQATVVIAGLVLWTVSKWKTYGFRNLKSWESQEELRSGLDIRPDLASTEGDLLSTTHHNSFTSYNSSSSLHKANMPSIRSTACALTALAVHLCNAKDWEGLAYNNLYQFEMPIAPIKQPLSTFQFPNGPDIDYYEIEIKPFETQLHPGLGKTRQVGYDGMIKPQTSPFELGLTTFCRHGSGPDIHGEKRQGSCRSIHQPLRPSKQRASPWILHQGSL
jgi:hypothetical protein